MSSNAKLELYGITNVTHLVNFLSRLVNKTKILATRRHNEKHGEQAAVWLGNIDQTLLNLLHSLLNF